MDKFDLPTCINVTFLPQDITLTGDLGDTLLDTALDNNLELPHECGGNCACTTCMVEVLSGAESLSPMEAPESDRLLTADARTSHSRLACQALLKTGEDVVVQILESYEATSLVELDV